MSRKWFVYEFDRMMQQRLRYNGQNFSQATIWKVMADMTLERQSGRGLLPIFQVNIFFDWSPSADPLLMLVITVVERGFGHHSGEKAVSSGQAAKTYQTLSDQECHDYDLVKERFLAITLEGLWDLRKM
ncbi:Hypothetical predicted protein [Pelobates cultripes]|uniref:Uncharacterized protein n=1 Tax=Pelobates cultripes TaxID=61616 RepID=A0AAD1WKC6_PELCU|nr:Hypothetical predicted protein [Pelobates cultripes]